MDKYINEFDKKMREKKLSQNTIAAYIRDILKFTSFLKEKDKDFFNIDMADIMSFVQNQKKQGKANSSIIRNLVALRRFYKFLISIGKVSENPFIDFEVPKNKRSFPRTLTVDEVDRLLSTPDCNNDKGIRDKAMLELMYATGVKVSELLSLNIFDVNLKSSCIRCIGNNKERIIPIGSYAVNCLREYIKIRDRLYASNSQLLFCNMRGEKMTRQGFWKIVKHYAKEANINKEINSYTLRHSFAVHLLQNGADMKSVQELLGHSTIATTQIYSKISKKNKIADIYKKTHPRA